MIAKTCSRLVAPACTTLLLILLNLILLNLFVTPADAQTKKKLSLAELAALEWKLEQGSNTLIGNPDVVERKKALADLASLQDPRAAKPLAMALKEDPDAAVRLKAAEALSDLKSPEAKGLLKLASESDPDEGVRNRAAALLKGFPRRMMVAALPLKPRLFKAPKQKLTEKLLSTILAQPSGDARLWAIRQLGRLKLAGRASVLERHMFSDPSARVRVASAQLLQKMQKKQSLPLLIRAVADGNPLVRFEVARLLADFNDPGALRVLEQLASTDPNDDVKAEARDLLEPTTAVGKRLLSARIKKLRSANPAQRIAALNELTGSTHWKTMVPMSCTLLNDKSVPVRTTAAKVLTNMHDSSILTALRVAAVLEPDKKLQSLVRTLLQGMRRRVDNLVSQLGSKDANQRALAARWLGQAAYPPGLQPLIAAIKDPDAKVRLEVVRGLRNYTEAKAIDMLKLAGTDSDGRVRREVDQFFKKQQRLNKYRDFFKDSNRVVTKTSDKDPIWRTDAAIALGISGAETAVGNLAQLLLHDKDEQVRLAAAWSLVLMASERGEVALKKAAAKDPSEKVRLTARKYLIIDKVSLDDMIKQLDSEDAAVRQDAADAISLRPKRKVINHMIRAGLCDPEAAVRGTALRSLARIANPLAHTALKVSMSRDPSARVRRIAYMMYILAGGK